MKTSTVLVKVIKPGLLDAWGTMGPVPVAVAPSHTIARTCYSKLRARLRKGWGSNASKTGRLRMAPSARSSVIA
jgi:hypothetical protein